MGKISTRSRRYIIPNFSVTGDLIAFNECPLQYRFVNKGALPPSVPVQEWFGDFIHGVMEEAFLVWKNEADNGKTTEFPWDFDKVQDISIEIAKRLRGKGLRPYQNIFSEKHKGEINNGKKTEDFIANRRAFLAVNMWGRYLFPLIEDNEVKLMGIRDMPVGLPIKRADMYNITGIADVITSFNIKKSGTGNRLVEYLKEVPGIKERIEDEENVQIIIDYKGTMRPEPEKLEQYIHQISLYMWLQEKNNAAKGSKTPIVAGVLLFLNELYPRSDDVPKLDGMEESEFKKKFSPTKIDMDIVRSQELLDNEELSEEFRYRRSIEIIPNEPSKIEESLKWADDTVEKHERCVIAELENSDDVLTCWKSSEYEKRRCTACDYKLICPSTRDKAESIPHVP